MSNYSYPEKLNKSDCLDSFDCGEEQLNNYLKQYAFQNQRKHISNTFVTKKNTKVVGYYTLVFGSVCKDNLPKKTSRQLPNYAIPVMILARLAVDKGEQKNGIGKSLLKDAILRTLQASKIAGLKSIMVEAKNDNAKPFYEKFDFIVSPINDLILFLPIEFLMN